MRAQSGLPSLRQPRLFRSVRTSISRASRRDFRIIHFSVQGDHLHLMVEATDKPTLSAGARGLVIRIARAINRTLGRSGRVWADRYHTHTLRTPREVRNALVYVLMNIRKHDPAPCDGLDPCSSALWFDGFRDRAPTTGLPPPVWEPETWLARHGWRRHGLIASAETPRV